MLSVAFAALGVPPAVPVLNTTAFLGRWYQTYASATVQYTFELGGRCVTADYGATSDPSVITVTNTVRILPSILPPIIIGGYAIQDPAKDSQFQVVLGVPAPDPEEPMAFTSSDGYWVIGLGPIVDGLYDWATVSDATQNTLYVLVRDVDRFYAEYETDILATLEQQGFTTFKNKPRESPQVNCQYGAAGDETEVIGRVALFLADVYFWFKTLFEQRDY